MNFYLHGAKTHAKTFQSTLWKTMQKPTVPPKQGGVSHQQKLPRGKNPEQIHTSEGRHLPTRKE